MTRPSATARGTRAWAAATRSAAAPSSRARRSGRPDVGLELTGPRANIIGSVFHSPDERRASRRRPSMSPGRRTGRSSARARPRSASASRSSTPATSSATRVRARRACGSTARTTRASSATRSAATLAPPVAGPPIRIDGGAVGADDRRQDDDDPNARNVLTRAHGSGRSRSARRDEDRHRGQRGSVAERLRPSDRRCSPTCSRSPDPGTAAREQRHPAARRSRCRARTASAAPASRARAIHVLHAAAARPVTGDPDPTIEGTTFPTRRP